MLNKHGGASSTEKCNLGGLPSSCSPKLLPLSWDLCWKVKAPCTLCHTAMVFSFWKRIKCFSSPYVGESLKHNNKRSLWICGWVGQGDHTIIMVSWFPKNSIFKMFSANCWYKAGFRKCSDTKSYWNSFKYHLKPTSNLSLMYLPFNTRTDSQVVVHKSLLVWVFAISCCMRLRKDSVFGSNRRHTTCVELGWVAKRWKNCLDFGRYLISTKVSASVRKTWSKRSRKWTEVFNLSLLASG